MTERTFSAGAQYGLILGVIIATATALGDAAWQVASAVLAVHLAVGAIVCWRRTGLALAAIAMLLGAADLALMAQFGSFGRWSRQWLAVAAALWAVGSTCMIAEPRLHPEAWAAWQRHMEGMSGWDILLGRHFPRLRQTR